MQDFSDRLRDAVKAKGLNLSSFLRELADRGVTGANRQSLYRYLGGTTQPPKEWLAAAAEVLEVPESWLVYGVRGKQHSVGATEFSDAVAAGVTRMSEYSGPAWAIFLQIIRRLDDAQPPESEPFSTEQTEDIARAVEGLVFAPMDLMGNRDQLSHRESEALVVASATTVLAAVPEAGKGLSVGELMRRAQQMGLPGYFS